MKTTIKDSGDRTQFSSGAVRDMHRGKGRFDVMPLDVVYSLYKDYNQRYAMFFADLSRFMIDRKSTNYLHAAIKEFCELEYEGDINTMLLEVAVHYEEGAIKYEPDNWRKGIPVNCYIDSAIRHLLKWARGDNDERHDRAFVWNLMCCIWEIEHGEKYRESTKTHGDYH